MLRLYGRLFAESGPVQVRSAQRCHLGITMSVLTWVGHGCVADEPEPGFADVFDDIAAAEIPPSDAPETDESPNECCPINAEQRFCGQFILIGGARRPGFECPTATNDGGGTPDRFWTLVDDEFGCPEWRVIGPVTEQCAERDAGVPTEDVHPADADDSSDVFVPEAEDSADSGDEETDRDDTESLDAVDASVADVVDGSGQSDADDGSGASDEVDGSGTEFDSGWEE